MKCLRCGPLIKAIDAYLAKAENDLYEQLTMEGYLKAKESLNTVDEIEAVSYTHLTLPTICSV